MEATNISRPTLTATDKRWARILEDNLFYGIDKKKRLVDNAHYGVEHPVKCLDIQATAEGFECYYTDGKNTTDKTFGSVEAFACLLLGTKIAHRDYMNEYPGEPHKWSVEEKPKQAGKKRITPTPKTKERLGRLKALAIKHPEKDLRELCKMAGVSLNTFRNYEQDGTFSMPPEYNLRRGRWRVNEKSKAALYRHLQTIIDEYCAAHKQVSMKHLSEHLGTNPMTIEALIRSGAVKVTNVIRRHCSWRTDLAELQQEINEAARGCTNILALSRAIGINRCTLVRWFKDGKLTLPELKPCKTSGKTRVYDYNKPKQTIKKQKTMREISIEKMRQYRRNYAVLTITDAMAVFPDFPIFQARERVDMRKPKSWDEAVSKLLTLAVKKRVVEEGEVAMYRPAR